MNGRISRIAATFLSVFSLIFPSVTPAVVFAQEMAPSVSTEWIVALDGTATTSAPVVLGTRYQAPQPDGVSVAFAKLPERPGYLSIKEIQLTPEQQGEIGAISTTAYEITSDMTDGSFGYELTWPLPARVSDQPVQVKASESLKDLSAAQPVGQAQTIQAGTISIRELDHFTIFVLVDDIDSDNPDNLGDFDDVANGALSAIDDTWVDEHNPDDTNGSSTSLSVRSDSGGTPDNNRRVYIKFNTSSIPANSDITKATLRLYLEDAPISSRTYQVFRVNQDWTADSLDWDPQPGTADAALDAVSTGDDSGVWLEWDVTSDVQEFVNGDATNYGWMVRDSWESSSPSRTGTFRSSEDVNELKRPQLIVDFADPSDQPSDYKSPTAEEATSGGNGDGFETSPTDAFADGGGVAANTNGAADRHIFFNYNPFAIPEGSSINGIEVRVDWYLDSTGGTNSLGVELSWDGGTSWTALKSDITETDAEHVVSLGGAEDTWDRAWTAEEFSNDNFRVRVTMNSTVNSRDFSLDWIPVRVYYTSPEEEDTTAPSSDITYPEEDGIYNQNSWSGEFTGNAQDSPSSGVATVFVSIQSDSDGSYWWEDVETGEGTGWYSEEEILNEADFDEESETWGYEFDFISPQGPDEGYTLNSHAQDNAGNLENTNQVHFFFSDDITPPTSTIESPEEGSYWNSPIEISGSSTDLPATTIAEVKLFYRNANSQDEWTEITDSGQDNEDEEDPFEWIFFWTPAGDGVFDIRAEAGDKAGNTEESPMVENITYDATPPETPLATPGAGDYTSDQSVTLASVDETSGLVSIYYTTDGTDPSNTNGTLYSGAIAIGVDTTLEAIAYDQAGNASEILTADYGIAPIISGETSTSVTTTSATITWTTDDPATSRVIYDTASQPELGVAPNYGYAFSSLEADSDPKVTQHSVLLTGLTAGTTYYYRTVSQGSPEAVSEETSLATSSSTSTGTSTGTAAGVSDGGGGGAPVCGDSKPSSAPVLLTAVAGTNSVTLTWAAAGDPFSYYLVAYGTSPGSLQYGNPNIGGKGTTSFTIGNLSGGITYYFRVRAGNGCMPGDYSNELTATPGGGGVSGPAAGFTEGVLGVTIEEGTEGEESVEKPQTTPRPTLGTVAGTQKQEEAKSYGWIWAILLTLGGVFGFWFFRQKKTPG